MQKQIEKIYYTSHFLKAYKKLSGTEKSLALLREKTFRINCFSPILKTHKLKGKIKNNWSFSLTPNLRVMFKFRNGNTVLLLDIGSHKIYK